MVEKERINWSDYVATDQASWYNESKEVVQKSTMYADGGEWDYLDLPEDIPIESDIWQVSSWNGSVPIKEEAPTTTAASHLPAWHLTPAHFAPYMVNFDMMSENSISSIIPALMQSADGVMGEANPEESSLAQLLALAGNDETMLTTVVDSDEVGNNTRHPHSFHVSPVFATLNDRTSPIVGVLIARIPWDRYLTNLMPENVVGVDVVLTNTYSQAYTYRLNGPEVGI